MPAIFAVSRVMFNPHCNHVNHLFLVWMLFAFLRPPVCEAQSSALPRPLLPVASPARFEAQSPLLTPNQQSFSVNNSTRITPLPVGYPLTSDAAERYRVEQARFVNQAPSLDGDSVQTALPISLSNEHEVALPPRQILHLPGSPINPNENIQISSYQDLITLTAIEAPLSRLLSLVAEQHGLNLVIGNDVSELISVRIRNMRIDDALNAILTSNGYAWTRQNNIVFVSKIAADKKNAAATQGRAVQVFSLNYVSATDIDKVVKGLLSPVGQSFIHQTMPADTRRTQEQLVVEDLPDYLNRIGNYLYQVDVPPRQVLVEAHVLQVTLQDNCKHGVNLQHLARIAKSDVTVSTTGLAAGTLPTSTLKIQGTDLTGILEAIKATTDAKTLASPKVAVINNQQATMQVGAKIGYLLTTTTQTSTLQSVNFLDVGVILKVLPSITMDGQVLIHVEPQVSTGRINPTTQLPESETTEIKTSILLNDGEAIVIGGLIKETDNDSRNKVPFLGDLWLVGWMFQRRETLRERNEIIITILPRIIPDERGFRCIDPVQTQQSLTPLLYGPLNSVDRLEFEPKLPSYADRPSDRRTYHPPQPAHLSSGAMPMERANMSPMIFMAPEPPRWDGSANSPNGMEASQFSIPTGLPSR